MQRRRLQRSLSADQEGEEGGEGEEGEEGRDKLRKATGIGTHELIRRYPNGATCPAVGIAQ